MTDLPPIANFISNCLIILLLVTFFYALYMRFIQDENDFKLTDHISSMSRKKKTRTLKFPFSSDDFSMKNPSSYDA